MKRFETEIQTTSNENVSKSLDIRCSGYIAEITEGEVAEGAKERFSLFMGS